MKIDKPNQGYIFRGTTWKLFLKNLALDKKEGAIYIGNRFTLDLNGALAYSFRHTKQSEDDLPCIICIDAKYSDHPTEEHSEVGYTPLSEIEVRRTDKPEGINSLVDLVKTNPNKELKELIENSFGNDWENYKRTLIKAIKEKKD